MAKLNSSSSCVLCSSPSHGLSNLLMDDFSGVGSGMQALVAALSSFVPKKKSHTILLQFIIILQMIQHLNEK